VRLGVEHILGGLDHLLFVLGLVLLVGFRRQLVVTVTAFTLAHSVTLATAVLGVARVPQAPVEAVIALSILLLAVECSKREDSLARRTPWAVALSFGLLHGFGFAGALSDVGLPSDHVTLALLCFNAGVEFGQFGVIAVAYALARLAAPRLPGVVRLERAALYAMGALAAFWSIERTLAAFS
ncbi:MAG TPA: HupE/UreJ family protein, partial [Polyangiaceae bacterium]|nr:HupE/UreJ family protein [Polyangiaceae bacterium]